MSVQLQAIKGPNGTAIFGRNPSSVSRSAVFEGWHKPASRKTDIPFYYLEPGVKFTDRFIIESLLAEGGMSRVFLAQDLENSGKKAVIKVVNEYGGINKNKLEFLSEERELYRLLNKSSSSYKGEARFPKYYGPGEEDGKSYNGFAYIAMEYIPGVTIRTIIEEAQEKKEKIPLYRAIEIAMQIASLNALGTLHHANYIHRDLKPSNVIINENGAYIIDFGIACRKNYFNGKSSFAGTPNYMAPEQIKGEEVSEATDVYALGIMLYEMINLTNPMRGNNEEQTLINQREKRIPSLSFKELVQRIRPEKRKSLKKQFRELHCLLTNLINKMTEKDPSKRLDKLEKLLHLLENAYRLAHEMAPYEELAFTNRDWEILEKENDYQKTRTLNNGWLSRLLAFVFSKINYAEILYNLARLKTYGTSSNTR